MPARIPEIGNGNFVKFIDLIHALSSNQKVKGLMKLEITGIERGKTPNYRGIGFNYRFNCSDGTDENVVAFFDNSGSLNLNIGDSVDTKVKCEYYFNEVKNKKEASFSTSSEEITSMSSSKTAEEIEKMKKEAEEIKKNKEEEEKRKIELEKQEEEKRKQEEQFKKQEEELTKQQEQLKKQEEELRKQEEQLKKEEEELKIINKLKEKREKELFKPDFIELKPDIENRSPHFEIFKKNNKDFPLPISDTLQESYEKMNMVIEVSNEEENFKKQYTIIGQRHPYFSDLKKTYAKSYLTDSYEMKILETEIEYFLKGNSFRFKTSLVKFFNDKKLYILELEYNLVQGSLQIFEANPLRIIEVKNLKILPKIEEKKKIDFNPSDLETLVSEIKSILASKKNKHDKKQNIDNLFDFISNKFIISDSELKQMKDKAYSQI